MAIYIWILFFLSFFLFVKDKRVLKIFLIIPLVILWLIPSLKDLSVGTDTYNYYEDFNQILTSNSRTFSNIQIGWYLYNLCFYYIANYRVFILITYAIIMIGFSRFIFANSSNIALSFVLFVGLFFYEDSFNIMRQYMSLSIVLLFFGYFFSNKKKFIYVVLLASIIHYSSLFCLTLFYVNKISLKEKYKVVFFVIVSFIVGFFFSSLVNLEVIGKLWNVDEFIYLRESGGDRSVFRGLFYSVLFLITLFLTKKKKSIWLKSFLAYVLLFNLFGNMNQGNRLFLFYSLSMLIVFPEAINSIPNKYIKYIYYLFILIFVYSYFYYCLKQGLNEVIPYKMYF